MRWGITDYMTYKNLTNDICFEEIELCKTESIGLSFIV